MVDPTQMCPSSISALGLFQGIICNYTLLLLCINNFSDNGICNVAKYAEDIAAWASSNRWLLVVLDGKSLQEYPFNA